MTMKQGPLRPTRRKKDIHWPEGIQSRRRPICFSHNALLINCFMRERHLGHIVRPDEVARSGNPNSKGRGA